MNISLKEELERGADRNSIINAIRQRVISKKFL